MSIDASILFPSDTPSKPTEVPAWHEAERLQAERRLAGNHGQAKQDGSKLPAGSDGDADPAEALFKDDVNKFDENVVSAALDPYALGAMSDGEKERAQEIQHATAALTANFKEAGTDSREVEQAFNILKEVNSALVPPSPEEMELMQAETMANLQQEFGSELDTMLSAARRFIDDIEKVAPGTKRSLDRNGAGNDIRLIRLIAKEAARRGYRS